MRIIYMGTPEFSLPGLEEIHRRGIEIAMVVTRPDRPAGRGRSLTASPVKERALSMGLDVRQPENLQDPELLGFITRLEPDLFVVSAYGKFIPAALIARAKKGGINLHPSLLPRYRGAAPIQWALINGEPETGVTIISISGRMDAGDIYAQMSVPVSPADNAATLSRRLADAGGILLADAAERIVQGGVLPLPQDEAKATFAPRLTKEDGRIDWQQAAVRIDNRVRGLYPWPGTFTIWPSSEGAVTLKILRSIPLPAAEGRPGEVLEANESAFTVSAGQGRLRILELQMEGKRPLPAGEFLRGHPIPPGTILGK
ncbi:MAG: methionyl-tRNA formyltransferase [PVC group bacterium]